MNAEFKIKTDESGKARVFINGIEMGRCITKLEYTHKGGELPLVSMDFVPDIVTIDCANVKIAKFPDEFERMVAEKYNLRK